MITRQKIFLRKIEPHVGSLFKVQCESSSGIGGNA